MKTQHGRDLTGEEMAEMLEEFANGASSKDMAAFTEKVTDGIHRTLQQKCMRLFVACIEAWASRAERPGLYDMRNEATVKLCKKMVDATGDKYDRHLPTI